MAKHGEEARTRWQPKRVHSQGIDLLAVVYARMAGEKGDGRINYHAALREAMG